MKCNHIKWTLSPDGKAVRCDGCGLICGLTLNIVEANKEPVEKDKKCIVKGCLNHKSQGKFIGDLCAPCYNYLKEGKIGHTTSFLKDLKTQPEPQPEWVKGIEQEFPELQKLMAKGEYQFLIEHFKEQLKKFADDCNDSYLGWRHIKKKWGIS